jgi:hypothetical protein
VFRLRVPAAPRDGVQQERHAAESEFPGERAAVAILEGDIEHGEIGGCVREPAGSVHTVSEGPDHPVTRLFEVQGEGQRHEGFVLDEQNGAVSLRQVSLLLHPRLDR